MQPYKDVNGWKVPYHDKIIAKQCEPFPNTIYQQHILDWALSHTTNFDIAIDIGANIGLHTLRLSNKFEHVYSFEPFGLNYLCLSENTKNISNVTKYKIGLGSKQGNLHICLPKDSDNCGAASLVDFKNSQLKLEQEKIEIKRLDDFNLSPSLIKIDVQGYELEVLKGAEQTIKKYHPILIVEVGKGEPLSKIRKFLFQFGYIQDCNTNKDKGYRVIK